MEASLTAGPIEFSVSHLSDGRRTTFIDEEAAASAAEAAPPLIPSAVRMCLDKPKSWVIDGDGGGRWEVSERQVEKGRETTEGTGYVHITESTEPGISSVLRYTISFLYTYRIF